MIIPTRRALVGGLGSLACIGHALAQNASIYPDRAIKVVCASAPGGGLDTSLRVLANQLQARWLQTMIVENRAGGSNNIAADAVARAAPDGYTLLSTTGSTMLVNKVLLVS